ncbi:MAG TPA: glucose-6-phosphate isomerase family protein [Puia sp.]|nr:glucose-6-phosphate isomerase family protein [Puia sp.]
MSDLEFDPGFGIRVDLAAMGFGYAGDCFGPVGERRKLDDIRRSLLDPGCSGPETVYAIAMDTGRKMDRQMLMEKHLLFGVVVYAKGRLGREPVRSQGHIHLPSPLSGISTPEVYEIWNGEAVIYMQETAGDSPGRCYAVYAMPGQVVIVPPGWAHATISANPMKQLVFGAWCDREYAFGYDGVRRHGGLAWFPVLDEQDRLSWQANPRYERSELVCKVPGDYRALNIESGVPIYTMLERDRENFDYVAWPQVKAGVWEGYVP